MLKGIGTRVGSFLILALLSFSAAMTFLPPELFTFNSDLYQWSYWFHDNFSILGKYVNAKSIGDALTGFFSWLGDFVTVSAPTFEKLGRVGTNLYVWTGVVFLLVIVWVITTTRQRKWGSHLSTGISKVHNLATLKLAGAALEILGILIVVVSVYAAYNTEGGLAGLARPAIILAMAFGAIFLFDSIEGVVGGLAGKLALGALALFAFVAIATFLTPAVAQYVSNIFTGVSATVGNVGQNAIQAAVAVVQSLTANERTLVLGCIGAIVGHWLFEYADQRVPHEENGEEE